VNIPSYQVNAGDEIAIRDSAKKLLDRGAGRAVRRAEPRAGMAGSEL
jgi:ribosomal protein S4